MDRAELDRDALMIAKRLLAEGFNSEEETVVSITEMLEGEASPPEIAAAAEATVAIAAAERHEAMKSWPATTDCDRLDAAFEELNARGIMGRHDWTCCSNCAAAEMPDEFERLEGKSGGVPIIGYTCYHQQNTESAAEGGALYLAYGSTERAESEEAYVAQCLAIAKTVCDVLESHGLKTRWDGSYSKKISVPIVWQRRARPKRFCGDREDVDCCG